MPIEPCAVAVTASPDTAWAGAGGDLQAERHRDPRLRPSSDLFTDSVSQLVWSLSWPIANMPGWLPAKIDPVSRPRPLISGAVGFDQLGQFEVDRDQRAPLVPIEVDLDGADADRLRRLQREHLGRDQQTGAGIAAYARR